MESRSSFEEEMQNIREARDKARSKMTTKEILLEISDNIAGSTPLMPEAELREIAYQSSRIADALHDMRATISEVFATEWHDEDNLTGKIEWIAQSLERMDYRQQRKEERLHDNTTKRIIDKLNEDARIQANRDEEQNRTTGDDSSSMPRKD